MYLHWLSRIHLRKSRIINIVQLLVGLFFLLHTSLLTAQELRWKPYKGKPLVLEGSISLKETLQQLVQEYAESPPPLRIHDEIPEKLTDGRREAVRPELLFELLLREQGLTAIRKQREWLILPDRQVWRERPFRRKISSPIPLSELLVDLADWGKVPLRYDAESLPPTLKITENLRFDSVAQAFEQLASRYDAEWNYDKNTHLISWQAREPEDLLAIPLILAPADAAADFLEQLPPSTRTSVTVDITSPRLLLLRGRLSELRRLEQLVQQFDQTWQVEEAESTGPNVSVSTTESVVVREEITDTEQLPTTAAMVLEWLPDDVLKQQLESLRSGPAVLQEVDVFWEVGQRPISLWMEGPAEGIALLSATLEKLEQATAKQMAGESLVSKVAVPNMLMRPKQEFRRFTLRYLSVGSRMITAEGQQITLPSTEDQLREFFQQAPDFAETQPQPLILPDRQNNALLIRGTEAQLQLVEELLVLWDQPSPLIRIEAHIFETTEKISRELGLRWRGTGVSTEGVRALEGPDFGLSWTAGPFDTSRGVRIDAMLRMLQEQGEGRVLSRPVVVTLNGLEAEMSSGSLLSVRLVSDTDAKLQQIQTGVTLRVTPRWIEPLDSGQDGQVQVSIHAETSTPLQDNAIDGIPQINSQKGRSSLMVSNGQPILMGGMIRQQSSNSTQGVPLFQDLPLLGPLFGLRDDQQVFDHVLVFVIPTLLDDVAPLSLPSLPELTPERASELLEP
ncbi:MAG: hypothetical protein ACO3QB_09300 [bacterium]